MMGADAPFPGKAIVHATFFSLLHSTGSPFSEETPSPSGPRKHGQSAAGEFAIREKKMEKLTESVPIALLCLRSMNEILFRGHAPSIDCFRLPVTFPPVAADVRRRIP